MGKPEGRIEDYLIRKCEEHGFLHYKFVSPSRRGVPDRIVIGNGRVVFVELKSEDGSPSKLQIKTMEKMRAAGADVRLYNSKAQIDGLIAEIEASAKPQRKRRGTKKTRTGTQETAGTT